MKNIFIQKNAMHNTKTLFFTASIALITATGVFGQTLEAPKNVRTAIKTSLTTPLFAHKFTLGIEQKITKKSSLVFIFEKPRKIEIPGYVESRLPFINADTELGSKISGYGFKAEWRNYIGKGEGRGIEGFYAAPYFAWNRRDFVASLLVTEVGGTSSGRFTAVGGGVQLGYQKVLKGHWMLDLNFLGIGWNAHRWKLDFASDDINADFAEMKTKIEDGMAQIPVIPKKVKLSVIENGLEASARLGFPTLRFGFSVGYGF